MEVIIGGYFIFVLLLVVVCAAAWLQGLILAFKANVILGIVCLFLEPSYIIFGVVYWFTRVNLAEKIMGLFEDKS